MTVSFFHIIVDTIITIMFTMVGNIDLLETFMGHLHLTIGGNLQLKWALSVIMSGLQ